MFFFCVTHTLPTDSYVERLLPSSSTGVGKRASAFKSNQRNVLVQCCFDEAVIIALFRLQIVNSVQKSRICFQEA